MIVIHHSKKKKKLIFFPYFLIIRDNIKCLNEWILHSDEIASLNNAEMLVSLAAMCVNV